MRTFKRYVANQRYPEGSITECFLMDESMMYAMNNVIDGENGSHKQGIKTLMDMDGDYSYPIDKKGKVIRLDNVQYQQARKWVLCHSTDNTEWKRC
ncbi:hypothetical protein CKAN_00074600 [Cinnamomum micranthum f. kanehirae]|uniref:Uncharacterized protein n=1 Tax=Cinnamomum micranthum f. kanehirae TaxID=337451 RepID=A0A3S3M3A5_9MAGN|nr:hypothetical protein CKAN_00074600 [Cinnamomum micranthum f. kanehirae]